MNFIFRKLHQITALVLFALLSGMMFAQGTDTSKSSTPVPYEPGEFPAWQHDLRRSEIIAFGALPFVTFISSIGYDLFRFVDNDFEDAYLPWPMKKKDIAIPLSETEQKNILFMSAGISIGFAVFDFIMNTVKRAHTEKLLKENALLYNGIIVEPVLPEETGESILQ